MADSARDLQQRSLVCGGFTLIALIAKRQKEKKSQERSRQATKPYVMRRHIFGAFHALVRELAEEDPKQLKQFLRMSTETFDELLHLVGPAIEKQDTTYKTSIPPEERLAVTLRYLADGELFSIFCAS